MALASGNELIDQLSRAEVEDLSVSLEKVALPPGSVLNDNGDAGGHVYFLASGVVSLVGGTEEGGSIELALSGREGLVGPLALLGGGELPFRSTVVIGGSAWRAPVRDLRAKVLHPGGQLHQSVMRYVTFQALQLAQSAVCNRFHSSRQRLARWLMLLADRSESDTLYLTHERIAQMVGGPRPAVTHAAGELRGLGGINYQRAAVTIVDRKLLRAESCECYDVVERGLARYRAR